MSDTTVATIPFTRGTIHTGQGELAAIEYGAPDARYPDNYRHDWGTPEYIAEMVERIGRGDPTPRYLKSDNWTFTPDVVIVTEPETREAQAQALAVMRRREAAAIERADQFENFYRAAQSVANDHRDELQKLWDALKEQAIERDWCSEFEQFVEDNGGSDYVELSKTVAVTLNVEVSWRDADSESELADHIYNMPRWDVENAIENYEEA